NLTIKLKKMTKKQTKVLEIPSYIRNTSKVLYLLNKKMATAFALKLFETPMKFNLPKREQKMFEVSHKSKMQLPECQKEIVVYENKFGTKKVLLVHNRKSTRLNSSHVKISYAVFCLKKKRIN